jgi:hypothetical protein
MIYTIFSLKVQDSGFRIEDSGFMMQKQKQKQIEIEIEIEIQMQNAKYKMMTRFC